MQKNLLIYWPPRLPFRKAMQVRPRLGSAAGKTRQGIKLDLVFASNQIKDSKNITSQKEVLNQLPLLFQNHPNPFNGFTFIDYFLPDNITDAFLRVIDNNGKLVKAFPINKTGFGQVELDCSNLAQGTYYYSLLVNNQAVDTKNMIISKTTDY